MKSALDAAAVQCVAAHPPEATYLIGVSGGRDSVALLHLLLAHGYRSLIVCHIDHAIRADSADDAHFVERLACRYELQPLIFREDIPARARESRRSLETTARDARYEVFARVCAERKCAGVFLAHHADDQVETILFNLFRGAAPGGLSGMRPASTRQFNDIELRIIRPLLGVTREFIDDYIASHALQFRDDSSNLTAHHTRNRIRQELLPALEDIFGRDICAALLRTAALLRDDELFLQTQLPPVSADLSVEQARDLPTPLQRRVIHAWLRENSVRDLSFDLIERVRSLLTTRTAKVNLPDNAHARRRAGRLFIERDSD